MGSGAAMRARDWVFPALREGAVLLMRGFPLELYVAQLFGNGADEAHGRQMPCHFGAGARHFVSLSSLIGTQIPQAMGAAWAAKIRGDAGRGARLHGRRRDERARTSTARSTSPRVYKVPCVFICQNNQWAISVPLEQADGERGHRDEGRGLRHARRSRVDGNDVLAVYGATREAAVDRARSGGGPTFIECLTYRLGATPRRRPDALPRRARGEGVGGPRPAAAPPRVAARRGAWSEEREEAFLADAGKRITEAIATVEAAPPPALETLFMGGARPSAPRCSRTEQARLEGGLPHLTERAARSVKGQNRRFRGIRKTERNNIMAERVLRPGGDRLRPRRLRRGDPRGAAGLEDRRDRGGQDRRRVPEHRLHPQQEPDLRLGPGEKIRHADTLGLMVGEVKVDGKKLPGLEVGDRQPPHHGRGLPAREERRHGDQRPGRVHLPHVADREGAEAEGAGDRLRERPSWRWARARPRCPSFPVDRDGDTTCAGARHRLGAADLHRHRRRRDRPAEMGGVFPSGSGSGAHRAELTDSLLPGTDPLVKVVEREMKKAAHAATRRPARRASSPRAADWSRPGRRPARCSRSRARSCWWPSASSPTATASRPPRRG